MNISIYHTLALLSAELAGKLGMPDGNIYYLAAPYSHPDQIVRDQRYETATKAAARLVESGKTVISPITMGHLISAKCSKPQPYEYSHAQHLCEALMDSCTIMIRLMTDGTNESVGIAAEVKYMTGQGKPIVDMYLRDDCFRLVYTGAKS